MWICGPPGCGKSTLVASYLARRGLAAAWCQLDGSDADIPTFFYHLALAVERASPRFRQPLPSFTPEYAFGVQTFAHAFLQEVARRLKRPAYVVLDDYQDVGAGPPLDALLASALDSLPRQINVIVISRLGPPAALARPQLHGRMAVLAWPALRLDDSELGALVGLLAAPRLDKTDLALLRKHTDGWIAGVVLTLKGAPAPQRRPDTRRMAAGDLLFDYFASEIYDRVSPTTRRFLLETAFLPTLTESIARALTNRGDAGRILSRLARDNSFTVRIAGEESAYQYHPMFRDFLLARAADEMPVARRRRIRSRAADILQGRGLQDDAILLSLKARDWPKATRWIVERTPALLAQGRHGVARRWIMRIPPRHRDHVPWLRYWLGRCQVAPRPGEARSHLEAAYRLFEEGGDRAGQLLAWVAIIEATRMEFADFAAVERWVAEMLALLARDSTYPTPEIEARVAYGMALALAIHLSDPDLRRQWMARAESLTLDGPDPELGIQTAHILSDFHCWAGATADAARIIGRLRDLVRGGRASPFSRLTALATEAAYAWLTAQFEPLFERARRDSRWPVREASTSGARCCWATASRAPCAPTTTRSNDAIAG